MTLLTVLLLTLVISGNALIHNLNIKGDNRNIFKIETFGFLSGGKITMDIHDFDIRSSGKGASDINKYKTRFILRHIFLFTYYCR